MPEDTDVIEIPLTIRTQDIRDLKQIEQDIDEADSKIRSIKSKRGKLQTGSSAPIQSDATTNEFGIFAGSREDDTIPLKTRDRTSRQPFKRANSFEELQEKVNDLEKVNQQVTSGLIGMAETVGYNLPFIGGGIGLFKHGLSQVRMSKGLMSSVGNPFPSFGSSGKAGSRLLGGLKNIGKFIPFIGFFIALADYLIEEVPKVFLEETYGPGKVLDVRFKRKIDEEIMMHTSRIEKAQKRQGFREVRISTLPRLRGGRNQVSGNLYDLVNGHQSRIPVDFRDSDHQYKPSTFGPTSNNKQGRFGGRPF